MDKIKLYFYTNTAAVGPRRHIATDVRGTISVAADDKKYLISENNNLVPSRTVIGGGDAAADAKVIVI